MEDSRIIEMFWSRDEKAIECTDKKYGAYCTSIAKNILSNNEDAKECVNDTYLSVWNSIPPKRPETLRIFLGKICRNISFNKYRRDRRDKRGGGETSLILDELSECVSDSDTVEKKIERAHLISEINNFLDRQNEKVRNIFVLRYWYFESIAAISVRFSISESNVYTTLSRTREKLRVHLTERGFEI